MPEIDVEQFKEWVELLWDIGWRGLIIFAVIYYRELVIHTGKAIVDIVLSWLKRKNS